MPRPSPPAPVPSPRDDPGPVDDGLEPQPSAWLIGGYTAIGLGAAAMTAGGILGGVVLARRADLDEQCSSDAGCTQSQIDDLGALAHGATGTLVAGGVILGLGLAGLIAHYALDDDDGTGGLRVGPGGLRGTF